MVLKRIVIAASALVASLGAGQATSAPTSHEKPAQLLAPIELITTFLTAGQAHEDVFAPSFLSEVPIRQVNDILGATKNAIGDPVSVEESGDNYQVTTETHTMMVRLTLNQDQLIIGLFLEPPQVLTANLDDAIAALLAFEGDKGLLITRNGEPLAAYEADAELAIGSAFKLGVLAALHRQIAEGQHQWEDILYLKPMHKSLPSGILQDYPDGSPISLHTASSLMISQSDNTATDMLMDIVGRQAVNDSLGGFTLTTREFFQLKADPTLLAAFSTAQHDKGRMKVIDRLARRPLPTVSDVAHPHNPGAEWYFSAETLCALIEEVWEIDLFQINPGVADPQNWSDIAFKGGGEIGVVNLTTRLVSTEGDVFCISFTLNGDQQLDEVAVAAAYGGVLSQLADADD